MQRRDFLKQTAITAATVASASQLNAAPEKKSPTTPIAKRTLGKTGGRAFDHWLRRYRRYGRLANRLRQHRL